MRVVARAESALASPRARRVALGVIVAVAIAVRLVAVLVFEVNPRTRWAYDMTWYDGVARRLVRGWGYVGLDFAPTAAWPPGYPVLLAGLYAAFGPSLLVAKLANVVLGAGTVLLTNGIACELGRPLVGLVGAAILAVFPGYVLFAPLVLSETLFVFLVCLALWLFVRWHARGRSTPASWLGLGVLLGAASLVRGVGFFLLPAFASTRLAERASLWSTTRLTVAGVAGVALALIPWMVRNQLRLGYPIMIASNGAISLYVGNSPIATGEHTFASKPHIDARFGHLRKLPNPQREVETARAQTSAALAWMRDNPQRVVALIPAKVYHMFRRDRGAIDWLTDALARRFSVPGQRALVAVVDGYYVVVLALALLGARRFRPRDGPGAVALPLTVVWVTLLHAVFFFGSNRFHVPLLPVLSVMAASQLVVWAGAERLTPTRRA